MIGRAGRRGRHVGRRRGDAPAHRGDAAPRRRGRRLADLLLPRRRTLTTALVLSATTVSILSAAGASAFWTATGLGTGSSTSSTTVAVALSAGSVTGNLYPGGTATVRATASNANTATVAIQAVALDTTQGTGGFTVDAGHPGCAASNFGFTSQSNAGAGWSIPAKSGSTNGTATIDLPNAVLLSSSAPDACQGASVTVFVKAIVPSYAALVTTTAGLLSYWRLGDASGTAITDSFGSNPGVWSNGPAFGTAGAITGDPNTATNFDGVDDYGTVSRQISDDFTIEYWFKSTQGIGTDTRWYNGAGMVDAETAGITNDFGTALRSDGVVAAGIGNAGGAGVADVTFVSTRSGLNDNAWHQVVLTRIRSSGIAVLYVDGVQQVQATGNTNPLTATANLAFGRIQAGGKYFAGSLDDISVYSSALPASTVLDHFKAGRP